jgi:alpha-ketoglutarate-dependent 2,4-dichlorophenoxyacetate dioxygenase
MPLTTKPLHPTFAAEISGVDIAQPLSDADKAAVIAAQDRYGVCVYRNTGLDDEGHIAFSRIFGHIELAPARPDGKGRHRHREIFDAGNLDANGNIIQDELVRLHKKGDRLWHTDSSFMEMRSSHSLLLAYEVPKAGGETWFADTRTAYDDLSDAMKARIADLQVIHSLWWSRAMAGFPLTEEEIDARPSAIQPLVLPHKGSGRNALYIAAHARDIVGMDKAEGRALIAELLAHASQPKYTVGVKWNVGDLVIWDNLATMHRGGDFDETGERRDMRRTTIREGAAPETPDDPFGDMFRASGRTFLSEAAPAR